jgi:ribose transport system permease protein
MSDREKRVSETLLEERGPAVAGDAAALEPVERPPVTRWYSPTNIGAIYVWVAAIIFFSILAPESFGSAQTALDVLNGQAVTALVALALVVPLSCAVFDLSIGYTLGVCSILVAKLLAEGMDPALAIAICIAVAVVIGVVNGFVVVVMRIDSFIGTLATGALLQSLILIISDQPIASPALLGSFSNIAQTDLFGITLPVFYALIALIALTFLLEHTSTGRRIYATGYSRETARLTGIRTERLRFSSLVISATLAGIAGIVLTARLTTGSPTVGAAYLLPAFAAGFVGATQFRNGRFNPLGTVVAVLLLGTGTVGLATINAPSWASTVFVGATLIIAVGMTNLQRRKSGARPS